ncbi:MAG TPA: anthranilate synthase component I family protein [Gaiellaceae bacterium]|nr:anthranilate synthase component I family protein [Gaiellaceae bacterium]
MLELYDADGAFEALEAYLAEELHEGLVADVYLGYGLGEPLRRERGPAPPEPCPLPLLAAKIRLCDESTQSASDFRLGEWEPTWAAEGYAAAVDEVRAAIARGDVYQVNLVQHLSAPFAGSPYALADALAPLHPLHPRPLAGDGWAIVSASPELFLARRGDRLVTMPIKGTRPIGEDVDDAKDAAEHVMIVDLERNDLSRVCEIGSVRWPELMAQHELAGVTHLVSTVEGRVRSDATLAEILRATFPGGSITGAPKISALDHIARLEPVGRGASMGALGTFQANGDFELALTIRTFAIAEGRAHLWVGGGIVWDSDPEAEIEESWVKARPLLAAVGGLVKA